MDNVEDVVCEIALESKIVFRVVSDVSNSEVVDALKSQGENYVAASFVEEDIYLHEAVGGTYANVQRAD